MVKTKHGRKIEKEMRFTNNQNIKPKSYVFMIVEFKFIGMLQ